MNARDILINTIRRMFTHRDNLRPVLIISIFITAIISMACVFPLYAGTLDLVGKGTKSEPYEIGNIEQLEQLRDLVNNGESFADTYFIQIADIDLSNVNWIPIGEYTGDSFFRGIYDGNGYSICNLTINANQYTEAGNVGLFGKFGGVAANIILEDVDISGNCCGGITSHSADDDYNTAIINCYVTGKIEGNRVGGIADNYNRGMIINCVSNIETQSKEAYGIISFNSDTKVYHCRSNLVKLSPDGHTDDLSYCGTIDTIKEKSTNWNIGTGLAQELFGNHYNVTLKGWNISENQVIFGEPSIEATIVRCINKYVLLFIAILVLMYLLIKYFFQDPKNIDNSSNSLITFTLIIGIVVFFCDMAAAGAVRNRLNVSNIVFLIVINVLLALCIYLLVKKTNNKIGLGCSSRIEIITFLIVLIAGLIQIGFIPRYDAHLYYGSLTRAIDFYNLDLFTFIGAFDIWKISHGTVLLIAPLEFILQGKCIGYIVATSFIQAITSIVFMRLVKKMFGNITNIEAAVWAIILVICPCQLCFTTHFTYDFMITYYVVWLIYAYYKDDSIMIAFCGLLMAFTKPTGLVYYVGFLLVSTVCAVIIHHRNNIIKGIVEWWEWKKVLIWISPAVIYIIIYFTISFFNINYFAGATEVKLITGKLLAQYQNDVLQCLVFGFRWVAIVVAFVAVVCIIRKPRVIRIFNSSTYEILGGVIGGAVALIVLLLLFSGIAQLQRYSSPLNITYTLILIASIRIIIPRKHVIYAVIAMGLLLLQNFITIDPSINLLCKQYVDTGKVKLRPLVVNAPENFGIWDIAVGDSNAYNFEFLFINNIVRAMLSDIAPTGEEQFYVLDAYFYEYHLSGLQYKMYWNQKIQNMTYDGKDNDNVFLKSGTISTDNIWDYSLELSDDIYLVVPYRVDETYAINGMVVRGYSYHDPVQYSDLYGKTRLYHFTK